MDDMIGKNRETMKNVQDIYDKLQENPFYREFLNLVRMEIAKIYGDQYYSVMEDAPPPPTITAKTPRMIRSGTSGGGAIALRSGTSSGRPQGMAGTYL